MNPENPNPPLGISIDGWLATVTLQRPEVRNAFDETLIAALTQAFVELGARADLRCIVLAGDGPAFSAGGDLRWMRRMADYSREQNIADAGALAAMYRAVAECPLPTVARVHGDAFAGGIGLVAACDMAVAADTAVFCLSEVRIGLVPATISPYVIRAMGLRATQRYAATAERFSAAEAHRIGLVHESVDASQLDAAVDRLVHALCGASPAAVRANKVLLARVEGRELDDALVRYTVETIADIRASDEGREGLQAFLQKRKPSWLAEKSAEAA